MTVLVLTLAPALLLFAMLALGLRPGEAALVRLAERRATPSFPRPRRLAPLRLPFVGALVDRALASSIAVRPPPLPAAATR